MGILAEFQRTRELNRLKKDIKNAFGKNIKFEEQLFDVSDSAVIIVGIHLGIDVISTYTSELEEKIKQGSNITKENENPEDSMRYIIEIRNTNGSSGKLHIIPYDQDLSISLFIQSNDEDIQKVTKNTGSNVVQRIKSAWRKELKSLIYANLIPEIDRISKMYGEQTKAAESVGTAGVDRHHSYANRLSNGTTVPPDSNQVTNISNSNQNIVSGIEK